MTVDELFWPCAKYDDDGEIRIIGTYEGMKSEEKARKQIEEFWKKRFRLVAAWIDIFDGDNNRIGRIDVIPDRTQKEG